MSDEDRDRADRLRDRRSSRQDRAAAEDEPEPSKPTVKEEQVGTYMYLLESQKKEIDRLYNVLKAEYEYEFDHAFEKNRHFYPLLVQHGLEGLESSESSESLDALEIKDRLEKL